MSRLTQLLNPIAIAKHIADGVGGTLEQQAFIQTLNRLKPVKTNTVIASNNGRRLHNGDVEVFGQGVNVKQSQPGPYGFVMAENREFMGKVFSSLKNDHLDRNANALMKWQKPVKALTEYKQRAFPSDK